jgi:L-alanine-DL-glutamate epimerase-like enolase superfamily enzyme
MTPLTLTLSIDAPKLVRPFIISTGARTHQPYLAVRLSDGHSVGRGAAAGLRYFGETPDSLAAQIEGVRETIEQGVSRLDLLDILPAGGARAAIDAALWELEAARAHTTVAAQLHISPQPVASAFTIVLDDPDVMAQQARGEAWRPLLKVKLGGSSEDEAARMRAVATAAPDTRKVIDANAGWTVSQLATLAPLAAELGYELLEQPLPIGCEREPASRDALLSAGQFLPLCADESFQTMADFDLIAGLYQAVNIKLDKCGGLTSALSIRDEAKARGLAVFIGCMLAPTVAIAPAHLLAQGSDYADLDGPFWFLDEPVSLTEDGMFAPIDPTLWGQGALI